LLMLNLFISSSPARLWPSLRRSASVPAQHNKRQQQIGEGMFQHLKRTACGGVATHSASMARLLPDLCTGS
jgi:L,D-peptidoglycan transpeptidase YkuD (ErfK/YbiS/YcfS/YnhG family)